MRIIAFVLSIIVASVVTLGGTVLLVTTGRHGGERLDALSITLAVLALTVFVYGPLFIGSLTAYWNVSHSTDARRFFRRYALVVIGLDVLGAAAIIAYTVNTGAPVWVPIVFIAVAAALMVAALLIGPRLLKVDERRAQSEGDVAWRPIEHREVLRKVLIIAATFAIALVITVIAVGLLLQARSSSSGGDFVRTLVTSLGFSFLAAAFAAIIVSLPYSRLLRSISNRDIILARKLSRVVLRSKQVDLDAGEQVVAAKYAGVVAVVLEFQLGYLILLYVGIGLNQAQNLFSGRQSSFTSVVFALLVLTLLVLTPMQVVRIRRAKRYANAHEHLIVEAAATPPESHPGLGSDGVGGLWQAGPHGS